uniref:PABS domain-containing protein n=1 Tax=Craspedostauros australis TaxID=1486917 RepID=A0A7R9WWD5_9STRA|eukprot:CAMPEP_0198130134 /NCGR_PEP_ID=MMETSP1442-20131203/53228_1 /TAXON_ID= /ORGANISM="Craspedostauros australis, Strain CCMP3328" /LENGTH=374 /DNA_ID=CAMNT_0043790677 /DNA_START=332 /DNA_END=1456 /DNA_ORIENTATION=+
MGAVESKGQEAKYRHSVPTKGLKEPASIPVVAKPPKPQPPKVKTYPGIEHGWFTQTQSTGQRMSLALEKSVDKQAILCHSKSDVNNDVLVFQSAQYGKVLTVDKTIQLTEKDERVSSEMMVHITMYSHKRPRNVLVLGGGDGTIVREVCRHNHVDKITMVEADPTLIEVSKKHLSDMVPSKVWQDSRLQIVEQDGEEFLAKLAETKSNQYDVIFINMNLELAMPTTPEPEEEESTSNAQLCKYVHDALKANGVVCAKTGSFWIQEAAIKASITAFSALFDAVEFATIKAPSCQTGETGMVLAQKGPSARSCQTPLRWPTSAVLKDLQWYNTDLHRNAFCLPAAWAQRVQEAQGRAVDASAEEGDRCFAPSCVIL